MRVENGTMVLHTWSRMKHPIRASSCDANLRGILVTSLEYFQLYMVTATTQAVVLIELGMDPT